MHDSSDGYNYICTHTNDFKVVAKDSTVWIDYIASVFLIKELRPCKYYLGNGYTYHDGQDMWTYGSLTYVADAVLHVERIYGCLPK